MTFFIAESEKERKFYMNKTQKITTCAMLIAASTVLAWLSKLIPSPWLQGGSVTIASSVPIIAASIIFGTKWGLATSLVYALIQMMMGFYPPPTQTFINYLLVVVLDYILAFGVYGLAGLFYKKDKPITIPVSGCIVMCMRYVCHILSGLLIWGVYAEDQSIVAYSLTYNGSYMIPEIIITTVVLALLQKFISKKALQSK